MKRLKNSYRYIPDPLFPNDNFFDLVYQVVRLIPYGRVSTYGAIARYLGAAKSARMVGWALNNSHNVIPKVPAHRVVNRNGFLTGYMHFATPTLMEELLKSEGIIVENKRIINFKDVFWDPSFELL
ncbi:MAG: MGMT family protein [Bacteroidales bacterium]|nr:MGMT family protein [Bacteroidales bacterium]